VVAASRHRHLLANIRTLKYIVGCQYEFIRWNPTTVPGAAAPNVQLPHAYSST
jgi:hypothetical protein